MHAHAHPVGLATGDGLPAPEQADVGIAVDGEPGLDDERDDSAGHEAAHDAAVQPPDAV